MAQEQLLFMRTGTHASLPGDFDDRLAADYDAALIAPADFRVGVARAWEEEHPSKAMPSTTFRHAVNRKADQAVAESLAIGNNVVVGGFLNLRRRRETMRNIAADVTGARVISLAAHTSPQVVKSRIEDQHTELEIIERRVQVSKDIAGRIQWPDDQEEHLDLNGDLDAVVLLRTIAKYRGRRYDVWA